MIVYTHGRSRDREEIYATANGTLEDMNNAERQIAPGEHVWVGFTDEAPLSLGLESPSQDITLKFSQAVSYSWYMATH